MSSPKTVLITGCSNGGLGSGLALQFQKLGFRVFATARTPSKCSDLKDLSNVTLVELDVTDSQAIQSAVDLVSKETGGKLDYLINNAGQNHFMPILDEDIEEAKKMFDTNLWGPVRMIKAFAPLLIAAKGTAVFITSIAGYVNTPYMGTYSASKRSLEIVAETLRLELIPFSVSVLSIVTGAVKSNGQTYFSDWALPSSSLYKPIETTVAARARGEDGVPRMPLAEYSEKVVQGIVNGSTGKFWYGEMADMVKGATQGPVPQEQMDAGNVMRTGLDQLGK